MTIQEAKSYINYGIKEGFYDEDGLGDWTDEQLLKFAEDEEKRAGDVSEEGEE